MREILFKAKAINRDKGYHKSNYKNGDWVYGLITRMYDDRFKNLPAEMTDENGVSRIEIDHNTLCQYTGLTDKNGNKIWENDIVKQSFYKIVNFEFVEELSGCEIGGVVIIPTKGTCMKNPLQYLEVNGEIEKNFEKTKMYKGVCQYRCEVIGNIFDNPELLKGEEPAMVICEYSPTDEYMACGGKCFAE